MTYVCPKCGRGVRFSTKVTVEYTVSGFINESGLVVGEVVDRKESGLRGDRILVCNHCKHEFPQGGLLHTEQCSNCGTEIYPNEWRSYLGSSVHCLTCTSVGHRLVKPILSDTRIRIKEYPYAISEEDYKEHIEKEAAENQEMQRQAEARKAAELERERAARLERKRREVAANDYPFDFPHQEDLGVPIEVNPALVEAFRNMGVYLRYGNEVRWIPAKNRQ